jgi:hypothetical protein
MYPAINTTRHARYTIKTTQHDTTRRDTTRTTTCKPSHPNDAGCQKGTGRQRCRQVGSSATTEDLAAELAGQLYVRLHLRR